MTKKTVRTVSQRDELFEENKAGSRVRSRYFWLVEVIKHRLEVLKEEDPMLCGKNAQNRKEDRLWFK